MPNNEPTPPPQDEGEEITESEIFIWTFFKKYARLLEDFKKRQARLHRRFINQLARRTVDQKDLAMLDELVPQARAIASNMESQMKRFKELAHLSDVANSQF